MKARISVAVLFLVVMPILSAAQIPRILSYQGVLADSLGNPKTDGTYTFTFRLYPSLSGGTALWTEQKILLVNRGLFHTTLGDQVVFGSSLTFAQPYWLGVQVAAEPELAPRIPLTSVGYSLNAARADTARYAQSAPLQAAVDSARIAGTLPNNAVSTAKIQDQAVTQAKLAPSALGWALAGNSATNASVNFIGTLDTQAVEFRVNNTRGLRIEPGLGGSIRGINVIGGIAGNSVGPNIIGATIAGGGNIDQSNVSSTNQVNGNMGSIGGGAGNTVSGQGSAISGGEGNSASSTYASVGGGSNNATGGSGATIGGGLDNVANGEAATVPGGRSNVANGRYSFAAGYKANATHTGSFVWADPGRTGPTFSQQDNEFMIVATNGVRLIRTDDPNGVNLTQSNAAVQIEKMNGGGEALWVWQRLKENDIPVVKLHRNSTGTNNFIEGLDWNGPPNGTTQKFHITSAGTFVAGSDFAEAFEASGGKAAFEPGDVVVLSENDARAVEKTIRPYDTRVVGIYSTRPGVLGADKNGVTQVDENDIPVAVVGIVPTKVTDANGPIHPGDLLTTSGVPGHAMRASPVSVNGVNIYPAGTILGKALEPLTGGQGVIKVLVTLR